MRLPKLLSSRKIGYELVAGAEFLYDPAHGQENLAPVPEPTQLSDLSSYNGVTVSADGVEFAGTPAASDYAYEDHDLIAGNEYRLAMYVEMGDASAPVPGDDAVSGDFSMIADGIIRTGATVTASGDGYLVVVTWTQEQDSVGADYGIVQYAAQSDKAFTTTEYHILRTAYCDDYTYINNDNFGKVFCGHPKNRLMSPDGVSRCLASYPYSDVNHVTNGGFETAGAGGADIWAQWSESAGDGALANEITIVHAGTDSCKVTTGASANTNLYDSITVLPGRRMRLSFWAYGDSTDQGRFEVFDLTNTATISGTRNTGVTAASWTQVTLDFIVPDTCISIGIFLLCSVTDTAVVYFDDVSAVPLSDHLEFEEAYAPTLTWPSATEIVSQPADGVVSIVIDSLASDSIDIDLRRTGANDRVGLEVESNGSWKLYDVVAGTPTEVDSGAAGQISGAQKVDVALSGATAALTVNGVASGSGATGITNLTGTTVYVSSLGTGGSVASITTKALDASGVLCRGGEGSYGAPWLGLADGDGNAFDFDENYLTTFEVTPLDVTGYAKFGVDANTSGDMSTPSAWLSTTNLLIDGASNDPDVGDIAAGTRETLELLKLGSRTNIYRHVNDQRQLVWSSEDALQDSGYVAAAGHSASYNVHGMYLYNLQPSLGAEDFSTVTDTDSSPIATDSVDRNAGSAEIDCGTITRPSAGSIALQIRRVSATDFTTLYVYADGSADIKETIASSEGSALGSVGAGGITDSASLVVVDSSGSVRVISANADAFTATLTDHEEAVLVYLNSLGTAGALSVITTHPYPGIVPQIMTGRIIAPQQNDTMIHVAESFFELVDVVIPLADDTSDWLFWTASGIYIEFVLNIDGSGVLNASLSGGDVPIISFGAGSFSDGESVRVKFWWDGSSYWCAMWFDGVKIDADIDVTAIIVELVGRIYSAQEHIMPEAIAWRVRPDFPIGQPSGDPEFYHEHQNPEDIDQNPEAINMNPEDM